MNRPICIQTGLLIGLLLCPLFLGACGKTQPGPEVIAKDVYVALSYRPPLSNLKPVYNRLAAVSRKALDQRAEAVRQATGNPDVKPWEVIGPRDLVAGDRVAKVEILDSGEREASVKVYFAWYVPEASSSAPQPIEVKLVREEDGWKVVLPLVSSSQLLRPGAG